MSTKPELIPQETIVDQVKSFQEQKTKINTAFLR